MSSGLISSRTVSSKITSPYWISTPLFSAFTSSGIFVPPTGVTQVSAVIVGGGAAGADGGFVSVNPGGPAGGCFIGVFDVVAGTNYAILIGAGGSTTGNLTSAFGINMYGGGYGQTQMLYIYQTVPGPYGSGGCSNWRQNPVLVDGVSAMPCGNIGLSDYQAGGAGRESRGHPSTSSTGGVNGGNGDAGLTIVFPPYFKKSNITVACGGGGGAAAASQWSNGSWTGGTGGGGVGGNGGNASSTGSVQNVTNGTNGAVNSGSGGGGYGYNNGIIGTAGNGGSGVVYIWSYKLAVSPGKIDYPVNTS